MRGAIGGLVPRRLAAPRRDEGQRKVTAPLPAGILVSERKGRGEEWVTCVNSWLHLGVAFGL